MRKLNKRQMAYLDKLKPSITSFHHLTPAQIEDLTEMNDHETLWSNIDRYLTDRFFKGRIAV